MMSEIPFVSVIIPMYNAEKYVGELLNSLLAQTLKNFEVIVVDDCSTDNSRAIVESFIPKFENRLHVLKLKTNSGGAAVPRNKGLELSRGKYILFMDADDVLVNTALDGLYTVAENYQTDVCYCSGSLESSGVGKEFRENIKPVGRKYSDKPVFLTEDLSLRIKAYFQGQFRVPPWLSFSVKDFLIENDIKFSPIRRDDELWTFQLLCSTKKFLMVPNICVIRRVVEDSLTFAKRPLDKHYRHWLDRTINGSKILDEFLSKIDFFVKHPEYKYAVINNWITNDIGQVLMPSSGVPLHIIEKTFQNEFEKELGEHDTLISHLFTHSLMLQGNLIAANKKIYELSVKLNELK